MTWSIPIVPNLVQRPTWLLLLLSLAIGVVVAGPANAQQLQIHGISHWQIYGTTTAYGHDGKVPGGGTVAVRPRMAPGEPWTSGAGMAVPGEIASGERVTAIFWARAARPIRVTVGLQGGEPDYARFAAMEVALTPAWQQVSVTGVAPRGFATGSQSLSVPLGLASAEVVLGPVAFLRGDVERTAVARAFADFRPPEIAIDVRVPSAPGVILAGTLHLPTGHGSGPFPLAVLIQGHGPNGRGGFPEIIKRLTADGIAALEYDKRGIGQSTGTYEENIERLIADAAAAVAAMRQRPEIDGSRIALVGQSQGGVIAPAVAAADPTIATVIALAGSVGDGLPYLRRAIYSQMLIAGWPKTKVRPAVDAAMTLLQARIDGKDAGTIEALRAAVIERFEAVGFPRPMVEGALAMIDTKEAWQAHKLRSASDLKALHIPVLAVFGTKDPLVVASDEAPAARAALANNPRARVVVLDGLSHWFQEGAITGGEAEVAKLGPNLGSPRLVTLVGDWLREVLEPASGKLSAPKALSHRVSFDDRRASCPACD
ncbi:MAG: alpha/beta fold hydrolase [Sphingomonadales bacterium]|nr:MAG: alpha/beta fold hydrolase [Sphingomonadales bacterium]